MIQPNELKLNLPVKLSNGIVSTTGKLWQVLVASKNGDLETVKNLEAECPALLYGQYNYTPPIHLAVREGHLDLVKYLLTKGAHDPNYKSYPFGESLQTIAADRGYAEIVNVLDEYAVDSSNQKFQGDNGEILYNRSSVQQEFEKAVYEEEFQKVEEMLQVNPEMAKDETFFWSEGILLFAAKENNREIIDLLLHYGAKIPGVLKWTQFYYFERFDGALYMMEKGMNPNTMSWQHVTILHDMAQKGNVEKAELLLRNGANINAIDEEYQSSPLGMASRWGHTKMVKFLLMQGADMNKCGQPWAKPLHWANQKGHIEIAEILKNAVKS